MFPCGFFSLLYNSHHGRIHKQQLGAAICVQPVEIGEALGMYVPDFSRPVMIPPSKRAEMFFLTLLVTPESGAHRL